MKLIYIVNARIPTEKAHGIQIMKMCEAFGKQGFEVELVIPDRANAITADPFEYYQIERKFQITKLFSMDLTRFGPSFFFVLQNFVFGLASIFFLMFGKRDGFVYTRGETVLFWPKFLTNKFPIFIETHFRRPKNMRIHRRVFAKARGVIVVTKTYQKELQERYQVPAEKILVAPDGVDIDKFKVQSTKLKVREALSLPQDKTIVAYTGHLYGWKGADVLLGAAKIAKSQIPNAKFVFVGGTEYDVKNFKEQAGDLDNVIILGHKVPSEIPKYLAAADVLVLPNSGKYDISRYYTSPLKLFEYMAANRPIVASDLPSIREVLNSGNALLVPPDDPEALARGIQEVLNDETLGQRLAVKARSEIGQYTWQKRGEKISAFIGARLRA